VSITGFARRLVQHPAWWLVVFGVANTIVIGCLGRPEMPDGPTTDADTDIDADADMDSDADTDADPNSDGDIETYLVPDGSGAGEDEDCREQDGCDICANDGDDDEDGFTDCTDPGCLSCPVCCVVVEGSWSDGDFSTCDSLPDCGWTSFAGDGDGDTAVDLSGSSVVLDGDGVGEAGFFTEPSVGLSGEPTLSFLAALNGELCTHESCRQALGVVYTSQQTPSAGTGVSPMIGVVFDGELEMTHFYVAGRLEASLPLASSRMIETRLHGFRVNRYGTVDFWIDQPPGAGTGDDALLSSAPTYTSTNTVELETSGLRVVAFGRLEGLDAARVDGMWLNRSVCDVPTGWARTGRGLMPRTSSEGLVRPAVARRDDESLVMVFEAGGHLENALSLDGGATWERLGPILTEPSSSEFGRVAKRAPTIVLWASPEGPPDPVFHMWFEGEAEVDETTPAGVVPTAIVHAVSEDGLAWSEAEESSIAVEGDRDVVWRIEVHQPTVAIIDPEHLGLWYVGRDPATGRTYLLSATSPNGKDWDLRDEPHSFDSDEPPAYERDGIADPTVIVRGGFFNLWYTGMSGSRTRIVHAISTTGREWTRLGPVLEAEDEWELGRVGGAAVVELRTADEPFETLSLWYHAGHQGRERIAAATRLVPVRE
jgi:hypothetical protein